MNVTASRPSCYGQLDKVFPMQADGLRRTPEPCVPCPHKTECLREAAEGRGRLAMAEERINRAYASGSMGFFDRWLQKKTIARKKSEETD
ncbi:MAG: hypothetical protein AB1724_02685 [Thermodesulfobacteriota bacterium]